MIPQPEQVVQPSTTAFPSFINELLEELRTPARESREQAARVLEELRQTASKELEMEASTQ
jgi:hypothetical protein